jgi:hypothetical protein
LKTKSNSVTSRPRKLRRAIGSGFFVAALMFTAWLPLGILDVVPFVMHLPGESMVRSHAGAAVLSFMLAAWGFWEN